MAVLYLDVDVVPVVAAHGVVVRLLRRLLRGLPRLVRAAQGPSRQRGEDEAAAAAAAGLHRHNPGETQLHSYTVTQLHSYTVTQLHPQGA